ncbi:hypothetical protein E4191_16230 (plasmid) [Paracoccus liaowanqingii]|uniref:IstB-like ATP-binding domain-containing protein n=1 Tax=Paracoccus liaowanqingii TaxID=2560053 RepID=A0A4Y5SSM6_9RHOB|nr:hypothetical protein E4191_16230 [Paracoccus liaowanqingii]
MLGDDLLLFFRDWIELLAGDEVLATAILDRLLHHAQVLNIKGRSYRHRDSWRCPGGLIHPINTQ